MKYKLDIGGYNINKKGCHRTSALKLSAIDWMCDLPESVKETDFVEVQFKNTRKGYYLNSNKIPLEKGDMVAVEASPGHDIGEVTLVGKLVLLQMKKNKIDPEKIEIKRIYRKAKETDLEKYKEAKNKEHSTMIKARQIAEKMNLKMKIGDVEYQGDGSKAIFYYIADERVDFRELIKVFAETFHVRIEMKQIGARQEAGRIGGIGPCGRELCCTSWMTNFNSVVTSSARCQDLSLNPQKLAGQCCKLKCCMNYELDSYQDAIKDFPSKEIQLETLDNTYFHFKTDVFKGLISYSTAQNMGTNLITISVQRAKEVIALNKQGIKPDKLEDQVSEEIAQQEQNTENYVCQDNITRFDEKRNYHQHKNKGKNKKKQANSTNQSLKLRKNAENNRTNENKEDK
ncbi:MAG TPA: regulatory iron-sulfur-containing complex subunit RicT [Paludibacteraceae bacterium]|nr:regulatory iron-sulfur-containing complex subunit RicT [Paludibacteraceae bacterium]